MTAVLTVFMVVLQYMCKVLATAVAVIVTIAVAGLQVAAV